MGITYKEYVYLRNNAYIDDSHIGGVVGCPNQYIPFLQPQGVSECVHITCRGCWNRELKYPVVAKAIRDGHATTEKQFAVYTKGEEVIVTDVTINGPVHVSDYNGDTYDISNSLSDFSFYINIPSESEENMNKEFAKADLKTGMIVEVRNGNKYMVYDDRLLRNHFGLNLGNYDDKLNHYYNKEFDIVKCFNIDASFICCIEEIFKNTGDDNILWQRGPEKKVISSDEAFKVLKEHYGCDVKIKES